MWKYLIGSCEQTEGKGVTALKDCRTLLWHWKMGQEMQVVTRLRIFSTLYSFLLDASFFAVMQRHRIAYRYSFIEKYDLIEASMQAILQSLLIDIHLIKEPFKRARHISLLGQAVCTIGNAALNTSKAIMSGHRTFNDFQSSWLEFKDNTSQLCSQALNLTSS